ncbi:MAG: CopG family transcriptional regulator [Thermoleophilia bacterium]
MKTAISLPDATFDRIERAARRMGVSRSEFLARAAERWLRDLEAAEITEAIDRALVEAGGDDGVEFAQAAADRLARADGSASG